jgi:hypothetical protein
MPASHTTPGRTHQDDPDRDSRYTDIPLRRLNWPGAQLMIEDAVSRRFVAMGQTVRSLLGLSAREVPGLEQWRIVYPEDLPAVARHEALITPPDPDRRLLGLRLTFRVRLQDTRGTPIGVRMQAVRLKTRHGLRDVYRIAEILPPEKAVAAEHEPRWRMALALDEDLDQRIGSLAERCQMPADEVITCLLAETLRHEA